MKVAEFIILLLPLFMTTVAAALPTEAPKPTKQTTEQLPKDGTAAPAPETWHNLTLHSNKNGSECEVQNITVDCRQRGTNTSMISMNAANLQENFVGVNITIKCSGNEKNVCYVPFKEIANGDPICGQLNNYSTTGHRIIIEINNSNCCNLKSLCEVVLLFDYLSHCWKGNIGTLIKKVSVHASGCTDETPTSNSRSDSALPTEATKPTSVQTTVPGNQKSAGMMNNSFLTVVMVIAFLVYNLVYN